MFKHIILIFIALAGMCIASDKTFETQAGLGKYIKNQINSCSLVKSYPSEFARQGVAVDDKYFYAINNREIGKYDKNTGKLISKWVGDENGPIIHLDSGVVVNGKLYCAHSNYHDLPMTSSVEVWDTKTMKHIDSHSFGINWGSLTWVDWHNNSWWATFGNYSRVFGPSMDPYGNSYYTQLIKFDSNWDFQEAFIFPDEIIEKAEPMSISGGSWGEDGYLYVTGHDLSEMYKVELPESGSILKLVDTIAVANEGQGIAWDRSDPGMLYTIERSNRVVNISECK
ncbi:MAG: cycloisomerase [Deferribacterota bacterium]|nr:cycloisomerase [Deferribacterota bacterium]